MLDGEQARVDGVILTHWHPDHVCELNRLLVSNYANRKRRYLPDHRVPLYCRHGSVLWLQREYGTCSLNI
ncbi:MAG: MBL fold metallo-hydrolase [Chloroflexota bacterium]